MERIDVELDCTHDIVIKYGVAECQNCGLEESKISKQLTDLEIAIKLEEIKREEYKQETVEEAAINYAHNYFNMHETNNYQALKQGFENGAKSDAAKDYWYKKFWEDYESQFKKQRDER
jgi:hypothetical protein